MTEGRPDPTEIARDAIFHHLCDRSSACLPGAACECATTARAVLAALAAEQMKMLGRDPTDAMLEAAWKGAGSTPLFDLADLRAALRAAWDVAPPTPTDGEPG